jgi:mono/diheme cytochrome c family protein|tara:strand:+ start:439 stop:918 length:480 start_codon:yes stop_codon:yes gene_type:complete
MKVNTRTISIIFFFVFSILLVLLFYTNYMNKDNEIRLLPNDLSLVTLGQNIYSKNCASCHGADLEGQENWQKRDDEGYLPAPPHDETGHTWHHPDEYLFLMTKYGIEKIIGKKYLNNMPAYKDILTDKEIIAVLSFIKSKWPNQIQEIHNNINVRSKLN